MINEKFKAKLNCEVPKLPQEARTDKHHTYK